MVFKFLSRILQLFTEHRARHGFFFPKSVIFDRRWPRASLADCSPHISSLLKQTPDMIRIDDEVHNRHKNNTIGFTLKNPQCASNDIVFLAGFRDQCDKCRESDIRRLQYEPLTRSVAGRPRSGSAVAERRVIRLVCSTSYLLHLRCLSLKYVTQETYNASGKALLARSEEEDQLPNLYFRQKIDRVQRKRALPRKAALRLLCNAVQNSVSGTDTSTSVISAARPNR